MLRVTLCFKADGVCSHLRLMMKTKCDITQSILLSRGQQSLTSTFLQCLIGAFNAILSVRSHIDLSVCADGLKTPGDTHSDLVVW